MEDYYRARQEQLIREFDTVLKELKISTKNPDIQGRHAEDILKKFLQSELPIKFGVGSGFIKFPNKTKSKQIDIIIYDQLRTLKMKQYSDCSDFIDESVFGCIEVKSVLTLPKLKEAISNIKSYKYFQDRQNPFDIVGSIFAYDGDINKIHNKLIDLYKTRKIDSKGWDDLPDLVCILNKGYIMKNPKNNGFHIIGREQRDDFDASLGENALHGFILYLLLLFEKRGYAQEKHIYYDYYKYIN